jgi:drug/metabolite transporter (DMT)-like permease
MPFDATVAQRDQTRGILLMLASVLLLSMNDVMGKWLVASFVVGQVVVLRSVAALVVLTPLAWRAMRAEGWRLERPGLQAARVALGSAEVAVFYWVVGHMPLADTMTYWMATPILVAGLSALLLGERVGLRHWGLILLGFVGVAFALGGDFDGPAIYALSALGGAVLYALYLMCTRELRQTPDAVLAWLLMAGALVTGLGLLAFGGGWRAAGAVDLAMLFGLGLVAMVAHLTMTRSLKLAPASVVVPYQYSFLLWAAVFGWLVWGDVPGWEVALGAVLIVASGVLLLRASPARD